jgi:hypothetical protein
MSYLFTYFIAGATPGFQNWRGLKFFLLSPLSLKALPRRIPQICTNLIGRPDRGGGGGGSGPLDFLGSAVPLVGMVYTPLHHIINPCFTGTYVLRGYFSHPYVCIWLCFLDVRLYDFSPRLFHMSSVSGVFEAVEIVNPAINHEGISSAFPFLQSDLYNETQPGMG